ncbi:rhomboid family intramembrane serine protease [Aliiglaciecola sp. CAU 1673]|uniref:rhomboid family intramembrane serine protease n=1 Tax=Aliiglaciecola sp. CAU 1673 TaxID=3032595 RepID=UPI0023DC89C4|nr:rhomboid family intramembrane serine protease [Aliiglaciecola sp. CAU 1673]MDF2178899.1 rhomboid family intramembrane serine protease [Aliiglaciecola sp. CAU 1673]
MTDKQNIKVLLWILASFALIELLNVLTGRSLNQLGIVPRQGEALWGVLFAPWLHANLSHFFSNILALALFSFLVLDYGIKRYLLVCGTIIIVGGLCVWLFGRNALHVGASGLVYGLFAFLLLAGFLSREFIKIVIAMLVLALYGGLLFGIFPSQPFISWESHLFGFLSGLLAARLWYKPETSRD